LRDAILLAYQTLKRLQAIAKEQKALVRWAFNITRHLFRSGL